MEKKAQPQTMTDPVCGMKITNPTLRATHEGKEYGFCSEDCLKRFQAEPGRYARGEPVGSR